jgi:Histidine kinase-, DNA gyrase B-, and HSP90-like ATPase
MGDLVTAVENNYRIVSPALTVKAMRDNGYKNTAYALAELIDNSIDAEAVLIEVFACENPLDSPGRTRHRVEAIAVLDNGKGMDPELLRRALKYGDGRGDDRQRIGRFGMGLPNSSMSQCTKVEVWSWTNGPGNAMHTYLDLTEINEGLDDVPVPSHFPVPNYWRKLSEAPLGPTGTLVVWTNLDRVNWFGATATLRNTAELIGRVYRHYLSDDKVAIKMAPVRDGEVLEGAYFAQPNDPLYLMSGTSAPKPFSGTPMFEPFDMGNEEEPGVAYFPIDINGKVHNIKVQASVARPEARRPDVDGHPWPTDANPNMDAGRHPWGKHAMRNIGISLVRKGRELDLDSSWAIGYDPVERWWGIEVDFPPELDEVFGVTNNKQSATIFSSLAHFDWEAEKEEDDTFKTFKDRLSDLGDPRLPLIDLAIYIQSKLLRAMRRQIAQYSRPRQQARRHEDTVTAKASDAVRRRQEEGYTGKTDRLGGETTEEEKRDEQLDTLTHQHHLDEDTARAMVDEAMERDWRVRWISSAQDSDAFFNIDLMAGMLQVIFNTEHPLHAHLMAALENVPEDAGEANLRDRLARASEAFKLLIFSWARMEDEIPGDRDRLRVSYARRDWGRYARDFIEGDGEDA